MPAYLVEVHLGTLHVTVVAESEEAINEEKVVAAMTEEFGTSYDVDLRFVGDDFDVLHEVEAD